MSAPRRLVLASVPVAAGLAWQQYRRAVRAVDAHPSLAPALPGERRHIATPWGSASYRWVQGNPDRPALVLVHGWGKTADSCWWPIIAGCDRSMVVVDLPGHGTSELNQPFTFALAADAVDRAITHAGVDRPLLIAHSMGGPVALTAVRQLGSDAFSGLAVLATSAYWVRPRLRVMMAMAPYAMAPRSPVLIHRERAEFRDAPHVAHHIAWAYTRRPSRRLLDETAHELRRFDARLWSDLRLPHTTWVVAARDGVLSADHQRASARHFGADIVELDAQHSMVIQAPEEVLEIIKGLGARPIPV